MEPNNIDRHNSFIYDLTVKLIFIGILIAALILGRPVLLPLSISLLLSFMLLPISRKLETWRIPRGVAIIISLVFAATLFSGLIYFFYSQVLMFVSDWPKLNQQISAKIDTLYAFIHQNFNYSEVEVKNMVNERISTVGQSAGQILLGLFTATGTFIASAALIPIFIFFITYYRDKFEHFIYLALKKGNQAEHALDIIKKVSTVSQQYLKGVLIVIVILSILNSTGYLLFGLPHAILFGVLAAILNIIPYIGVIIGSVLPVLMALITKDHLSAAIGVLGVSIFVQFLENNFITPYVVGSSVSINPLTAIIALVTSALIWGVVGMVLALPFVGMLKVAFDNIEALKPYGYLIGEEKHFSPDNKFKRRVFQLRKRITKPEDDNK